MKKSELLKAVCDRMVANHEMKISRSDLETVITEFCGVVKDTVLKSEEEVLLPIGKFYCKNTPPREGHNPKTMEKIKIPGKKKLAFKPFSTLTIEY